MSKRGPTSRKDHQGTINRFVAQKTNKVSRKRVCDSSMSEKLSEPDGKGVPVRSG